ncbi:hypothetical protein EWM64_g1341 [Hericium alpestre]|uniref:Anaphase-promoting complex subunit 5 n=1 Tax=Hericium alpestre TaxID=135208 RepID=A0A4Z0A9R5_9AGAM|nr:hypothetical protein EWM64_g1341 [Hericium alpestre]
MDPPEPPPTTHTIRPHHHFHPYFLRHVYNVLLHQVSEVDRPSEYEDIIKALRSSPYSDLDGAKTFFESLAPVYVDFMSVDHMTNFFHGISYLFVDTKAGQESVLHRRSILGYFCRRCFVTFVKMSFAGVVKLREDYTRWLAREPNGGYDHVPKDLITYNTVLFKTHADEYEWARPEAYARFERGIAIGDVNVASENLRHFFEQHFHDGNDSGLRQHALLNLSRMHYLQREWEAARKFLTEAIDVSRTASDNETLQHCQSLLHRLPPPQKSQRQYLNEIQPALHPLEVLFDVEKLMRVSNEQPLSASFEKLVEAIGLYDHWIDRQGHFPDDIYQWGQHAVQSIVWNAAGCEKLATIEEDMVTIFTERAGDDNNTITRARQGKYQDAIAILLEPHVWRGLTLADLNQWASHIWHILVLRASRRGQERQFNDFLQPRRASGPFNPKEYFFNTNGPPASIIRDPLYEVMQMKQVDQAAMSVEQLLKALWHAEFQCRYGTYRTGIIMLAEIGLEFGMTKRCRRILDEIMPQIIDGDNLEQRALACFVLARCIIAAGEQSRESIEEALPYLKIAEQDYATLEMFRSLADVQYLIAVLYNNLGMMAEREAAAERHLQTEEERKKAAVTVSEPWVIEVWDLVCEIVAKMAAR